MTHSIFRTRHPFAKVIAQGESLALIKEPAQPPALYDSQQNILYSLYQPSFGIALGLLPARKTITLNAIHNEQSQIVGFSLHKSAALVGLFTTSPDQRPLIPDTTRVLVTRQGLHVRSREHDDWQTLIWHPGL